MSYFKRLETIFILIVILVLGIAYGILSGANPRPSPSKTNDNNQAGLEAQSKLPDSSEIKYQGEDGKNALELLKAKYTVEVTSFGDLGEFVKSINGVSPDSSHFWSFYVNGSQSQVGAQTYITKSSDTVEWKLEEIK